MKKTVLSGITLLFIMISGPVFAQSYSDYNQKLVDEHIFKGFPGFDNIHIRQAYILSYNNKNRIANWVAYHVKPDYLKTVPHYGRFAALRADYSVHDPVFDYEYDRLENDRVGLAPGHLAPFSISGGDRDDDDLYGVKDANRNGRIDKNDMIGHDLADYIDDANEISRVYEINNLTNIIPQDRDGFMGPNGIWGKLEHYLQQTIVKAQDKEIWVMAGPVLGKGPMKKVGPHNNITVPPMYFKIAVRKKADGSPIILAFLIPHHKLPHGTIQDYLVSVDMIEALTGLDFFRELDDAREQQLEAMDTWENWRKF